MKTVLKRAEHLASRLGRIAGVEAVALVGAWTQGDVCPNADVDLSLYYHPTHRPAIAALRQLAEELDDHHRPAALTDLGGWGPWLNGGGWLEIEGQRVEWRYRDLDLVTQVIDDCRAGRTACHHQPGHPDGFHTHTYLGEVFSGQPLYDPAGTLAALKALVLDYPPHLKRAVIDTCLWEASFALDTASAAAARNDTFLVAGALFRCAAALAQVLFALNEQYFLSEQGAIQAVASFPQHPPGFGKTVCDVLAHPGTTAVQLGASMQRFRALVQAVQELC